MHVLDGVTLACIDTENHALALRALAQSLRGLRFARSVFLTDALPDGVALPPGVELRPIARLASRDDYSRFVLKSLLPHIATPHVLLIQWDGYVVNPAAFESGFLGCDYIGAKWFWYDDGMRVGNGGFSLRSRRLLEALQDARIVLAEAEDVTIGRVHRPLLEREYGIRFADDALADRFAFEAAYPTGLPFGFHGLYNFCRVVPEAELAELAPRFSDAIARSVQLGQLLRNCIALGQWLAAAALARRRLAVVPDDQEARALLVRADAGLASGPLVGRNDPCPCGSGRRYKQCHGSLGSATPAGSAGAAAPRFAPAVQATPRAPPRIAPSPSAQALAQQGVVAHHRGDIASAERAYRAALQQDPKQPLALHYLGVALYQRNRPREALPLLERSVAEVPGEAEFHNNLGLALAALDRNDDAIAAYRQALDLKPDHATAANNLGLALQAINRVPEAIGAFRRALSIDPAFAHAHWNLALALLANGEYAEGWREYEWRLRLPELGARHAAPPLPRWDGDEELRGKSLLVTLEQGVGDAVQFIRFVQLVAARGVRVVVQAPSSLCPLLGTAPGVDSTVATGRPLPAFDAEVPMLSLARILDVRADSVAATRYLGSDPQLRAEATRRIAGAGVGKRKIGIAWAGAPQHRNDHRRSMPAALLAPLFELPDIAWFSLQQGPREETITGVPAAAALTRLDPDAQWPQTAALIDALDLVVTVDTSIAHVAGGLGRPVFVMLPFAPDWRWGTAGDRTPWYASARLFRQPAVGDWRSVIANVVLALQPG